MNKRYIASEAPTGRRRLSQAPEWAWRRPVATVLLFVYGWLPLLPSHALAAPPPLPDRPPVQVGSLKGNTPALSELPTCPSPLAALTEPASQETSLGSARLAALPQRGITPNLLPPSILPPPASATASSHVTAMGRLPLAFIENKGQVDERARFYARSGGQTVWLTSEGLRFDLLRTKGGADPAKPDPAREPFSQSPLPRVGEGWGEGRAVERERLVFTQDFVGATTRPTIEARNPLPGIYNFFLGNDPAKWRTEVKGYGELIYREVWDGIDLKLYGNGRALEQEFIVKPGGDLSRIKVAYRGIEGLQVTQDGSLLIATAFGELKESPPRIYQEIEGERIEVAGRFKLLGATAYTFEVGPYHPQYALVIDPTLLYSTYLGGSSIWWNLGDDNGRSIAVDAAGNAYVTGETSSDNFPTTPGAFQSTLASVDVFVTKLDPTGTALVYSTYLGGSNWNDEGRGIAVDAAGNAYVTGTTDSSDFPTTPGAFQGTNAGWGDVFVTKLNPTGSALVYSTYLGGSNWNDEGRGIAVDAAGNAYVTGTTDSSDFPTTPGAFQGTNAGWGDVFVTKLNPTGSALVYSTYLGGSSGVSRGFGIAVDASGNAYVTGQTGSSDFPTTPGAFQGTNAGWGDAFVTKLNPTGSALVYSTYLGGSDREFGAGNAGIAVDAAGSAYVTGGTESPNFPTTPGAFQSTFGGISDAFVTKLTPTGTALVYSTYLGGGGWAEGSSIAVDGSGNAYVTGVATWDFPTTPGAFQSTFGGISDAFVTKLTPTGTALVYSTYLGGSDWEAGAGIAVDALGTVYVTGGTGSSDFPTTPGAFRSTFSGGGNDFPADAFVTRFAFGTLPLSVSSITPGTGGDTGLVSVTIFGGGYVTGATVKLVQAGQPDIVGDPVALGVAGVSIATTFDLVGKARGLWDVVVTNPDGGSATLPGGFTIEEGRAAQVWVDIIGRPVIRLRRPQTFYIVYGNRGNVDAVGVPAWIGGIPSDATLTLGFDLAAPDLAPIEGFGSVDLSQAPFQIQTSEDIQVALLIPKIPPGFTGGVLPFKLTIPATRDFVLQSWVNDPLFTRSASADRTNPLKMESRFLECTLPALKIVTESLINSVLPTDCWPTDTTLFGASPLAEGWRNYVNQVNSFWDNVAADPNKVSAFIKTWAIPAASGHALFAHMTWPVIKCAVNFTKIPIAPFSLLNLFLARWPEIQSANATCEDVWRRNALRWGRWFGVSAQDPNDKAGSRGVGEPSYLSGEEPLRYSIFFENVETATAPAQEVVITDQLDGTKMDLSTFSFGPIAFGNQLITPSPGLTQFTTDVDLRPTKNLIVRITAGLDVTTGLATWRYTSIDPATGQLTEDPLGGFLPPNVNPPEGDGNVLFTVMPKKGLPTGTEVRNLASIVFDLNPPIATPEWLNTLDNSKPVSQVLPLAATQPSTTFPVQWAGTDEGAGIQDFTIFVSEDSGPYTVWLPNTPDTGGTFTGQLGKRYAFYSVARDQTGNVESKTPAAEATTQVNALPLADAGADQRVNEGDLVTLSGSGSDPDGGPVSFFWTQIGGPSISLEDPTAATPSFRAFVSSLTAFTFQLTVSDGFTGSTDTVVVTVQDLGPSLHGTVTGSGPVAGAQVVLKGKTQSKPRSTVSRTTTTDATGQYAFTALPPGPISYRVTVSHPGHSKQKKSSTLGPAEDAVLDFSL